MVLEATKGLYERIFRLKRNMQIRNGFKNRNLFWCCCYLSKYLADRSENEYGF